MWLDVLNYLAKVFREEHIGKTVFVGGISPTEAEVDDRGALILMRGEERPKGESTPYESEMTFYLELWIRDDSSDIKAGYERLARLEEKVDTVLNGIRENIGSLEDCMVNDHMQLLDVRITAKVGDADSLRPLVGSQYTLQALLYDVEEEGIW